VVKDLTPPSRGRRRWRWLRSQHRPRRGKRGAPLVKLLLALALLALLVWQAPALKRLAGLQPPPPPAAVQPQDGTQSVEVPLPAGR
jgi:predicted exporter